MKYTIKEVSELLDLPSTTIRYYDKEGLLPFIERKESGYRQFKEEDVVMLKVIECLKKTGMPIKEIKQFSKWVQQGDASLEKRYLLFAERKMILEKQIADLQETLAFVNHKSWYYQTAIEAGTEAIHFKDQSDSNKLPCEE